VGAHHERPHSGVRGDEERASHHPVTGPQGLCLGQSACYLPLAWQVQQLLRVVRRAPQPGV